MPMNTCAVCELPIRAGLQVWSVNCQQSMVGRGRKFLMSKRAGAKAVAMAVILSAYVIGSKAVSFVQG